jgi:hypothetical protein
LDARPGSADDQPIHSTQEIFSNMPAVTNYRGIVSAITGQDIQICGGSSLAR